MLGLCIDDDNKLTSTKNQFHKIHKKQLLYDLPFQATQSSKSYKFKENNFTFFRASFNQHLNCNARQNQQNIITKQQQIELALQNKEDEEVNQQLFKIHSKPSRCINFPKYPAKTVKLLSLYEDQRTIKNTNKNQLSNLTVKNQNFSEIQKRPQKRKEFKTEITELPEMHNLLFKILTDPLTTQQNELADINANPHKIQFYGQFKSLNDQLVENQDEPISPCKKIQRFDKLLFGCKVIRSVLNQQSKKLLSKNEKAERMSRIRINLLLMITYLNKLNISGKDFMSQNIFSHRPFEKPQAKEFIQACKSNNLPILVQLLDFNRYLVYDFDNLMMTGLHWAAKRGNLEIALKLLNFGADPDAQDIIGRSPLYLAIENKNNDIVQVVLSFNIFETLMYKQADPWSKDNCEYTEILKDNIGAAGILSQSRKIHILLRMTPPSQRQQIWQKEQLSFYIDPSINKMN